MAAGVLKGLERITRSIKTLSRQWTLNYLLAKWGMATEEQGLPFMIGGVVFEANPIIISAL